MMRAKSEEFSEMSLKAVCCMPTVERKNPLANERGFD
jgi:hypothetical protein